MCGACHSHSACAEGIHLCGNVSVCHGGTGRSIHDKAALGEAARRRVAVDGRKKGPHANGRMFVDVLRWNNEYS